jgi:hypothetical protein
MGLFFWATPRAPFQAAHHRVLNAGSARSLLLYRFEPVAVDLLPARRFARAPPARHPDAPLAAARVALPTPPPPHAHTETPHARHHAATFQKGEEATTQNTTIGQPQEKEDEEASLSYVQGGVLRVCACA